MKRFFMLAAAAVAVCGSLVAQTFNENDRKMFNEGQVLTKHDLEFASEDTPYNVEHPKSVYSIHNEGDETIVTFSHSIYFDSQWVTFSKGIVLVDCETGDIYQTRGYAIDGITMDNLLIVKDCNRKNILVPLRFPKLKRKVKYIDVYSRGHEDDLKPSNRSSINNSCLGEHLSVKRLRNKHKGVKVYK